MGKGEGGFTHDFTSRDFPFAITLPCFYVWDALFAYATCELDTRHGHSRGRLLERGEGAVEVEGNVVGGFTYCFSIYMVVLCCFHNKSLGLAVSEVEA